MHTLSEINFITLFEIEVWDCCMGEEKGNKGNRKPLREVIEVKFRVCYEF